MMKGIEHRVSALIIMSIVSVFGICSGCSNKSVNSSLLSEGWESEIIDDKGDAGIYSSIVLDRDNNPHIVYYSTEGLKYAFRNNAEWSIQIIEKGRFAGEDPKIVLDSYARPHITYFFYDPKKNVRGLKYAYWTGSEWQIIFIDEEGIDGNISIDSKDRPHIAYSASFGNTLGYAYWDGEKWYKQKIDVLGNWRQYKDVTPKDRYFGRTDISFVLDKDDNPHFAYFGRRSGDLRYVHLVDNKWDIQVVDNKGLAGLSPSIALDKMGGVHITYLQADDYDLKYAYWDKNEWHVQIVDAKNNTGCDSIILLDGVDKLHVIYQRCNDEELKYAFFDGTKWNIELIEARNIGWTTAQSDTISMVLDNAGQPHISCYDNQRKALKYIYKL